MRVLSQILDCNNKVYFGVLGLICAGFMVGGLYIGNLYLTLSALIATGSQFAGYKLCQYLDKRGSK